MVIKDANRGYWNVSWLNRGQTDPGVNGYYETCYRVTITTDKCQPSYTIEFDTTTMYDEPLMLDQVASVVHEHIMRFYDACLKYRK